MALLAPVIAEPYIPSSFIKVKTKKSEDFDGLKINLPQTLYKTVKIVPIPFDMRQCNGGRFDSLNHAMEFVAKHCFLNHYSFTKHLAKMYMPFCRVINFATGQYEVPEHVKKADFNSAFQYAHQKLETNFLIL